MGKFQRKLNDKIAKKVLEPYMTRILKCAYELRSLSYAMPFEKWCEKFYQHLKDMNEMECDDKC